MDEQHTTNSIIEHSSRTPVVGKNKCKNLCRRSRILLISFLLTLMVVIVVYLVLLKTGILETLLVNYFGPPKVTLQEAYDERSGGPDMDHSVFGGLLEKYVDSDGWVDYENLKADTKPLDRYIEAVSRAPFDEMGRSEKLALLINAYNAFTLKLIVEHYPISSIKDIPAARRWDDIRWNVGGNVWSLTQIEQEQIRPKFKEPRIHFALVCAAVGCPPLRIETYQARRLEAQLTSQAAYIHRQGTWFQYDESREDLVHLTKLYSWYGDDFTQVEGSPIKYAARYSSELHRSLLSGIIHQVRWLDYDWTLNDKKNKSPR